MNTKFRNIEPFYGFLRTSFSSRLFHQIVGFPLGGGEGGREVLRNHRISRIVLRRNANSTLTTEASKEIILKKAKQLL